MKAIPLTQGKVALVDDADYEWLMQWKWCVMKRIRHGEWSYYAVRNGPKLKGKRTRYILMHRELAAVEGLPLVDHRDLDGLNNQRHNLRPCTRTQNQANRRKVSKTQRYKGVMWSPRLNKWIARITVNKRSNHIGVFTDEQAAFAAYCVAAKAAFGEFARLE